MVNTQELDVENTQYEDQTMETSQWCGGSQANGLPSLQSVHEEAGGYNSEPQCWQEAWPWV